MCMRTMVARMRQESGDEKQQKDDNNKERCTLVCTKNTQNRKLHKHRKKKYRQCRLHVYQPCTTAIPSEEHHREQQHTQNCSRLCCMWRVCICIHVVQSVQEGTSARGLSPTFMPPTQLCIAPQHIQHPDKAEKYLVKNMCTNDGCTNDG